MGVLRAAVGAFVVSVVGTLVAAWLEQRGWHATLAAGASAALATLITYPWPRRHPQDDWPVPASWRLRSALGAVVVAVIMLLATIAAVTAVEELRDETLFDPQAVARTFDGVDLTQPLVDLIKTEVPAFPNRNDDNGPDRTTTVVPPVQGAPQGSAESLLRFAGFQIQVEEVPSDQPAGIVVDINPPGGTEVARGSTVTLRVSTGPGPPDPTAPEDLLPNPEDQFPNPGGLPEPPADLEIPTEGG